VYQVPIPRDAAGQFALRAYIGWWKYPDGYSIEPTQPDGEPTSPVLLDAGALVSHAPPLSVDRSITPVSFGGLIALMGYTLEGDQLTLLWQATGQPGEDYTVMAFALQAPYQSGENNVIIAQGDAPPSLPTRFWQAGDQFTTQHRLAAAEGTPPGDYPVYIGWYSTRYPARLETNAPDNAYPLINLHLPAAAQRHNGTTPALTPLLDRDKIADV